MTIYQLNKVYADMRTDRTETLSSLLLFVGLAALLLRGIL